MTINGRLYIFSNLSPESAARKESSSPVKIIDFALKKAFGVDFSSAKPDNRPQTIRINYSIANYKHKVYLYGGLNWESHTLETVEEFDATTYKFSNLKIRGDFKPKGRQAHCAVAVDQYNMFVFGGSYSPSLIDPAPITDDTAVMIYDMDSSNFTPVTV